MLFFRIWKCLTRKHCSTSLYGVQGYVLSLGNFHRSCKFHSCTGFRHSHDNQGTHNAFYIYANCQRYWTVSLLKYNFKFLSLMILRNLLSVQGPVHRLHNSVSKLGGRGAGRRGAGRRGAVGRGAGFPKIFPRLFRGHRKLFPRTPVAKASIGIIFIFTSQIELNFCFFPVVK